MLCLVVRCNNKLETVVQPPISNHPKCEDLVVAYGRWSLTRTEPHGVSSEKRSRSIYFLAENLLHVYFVAENLLHVISKLLVRFWVPCCHWKFFEYSAGSGVVHTANIGTTPWVKFSLTRGMENYKTVRWWFTRGSSDYRALTGKMLVLNTEVPRSVVLSELFYIWYLSCKAKAS